MRRYTDLCKELWLGESILWGTWEASGFLSYFGHQLNRFFVSCDFSGVTGYELCWNLTLAFWLDFCRERARRFGCVGIGNLSGVFCYLISLLNELVVTIRSLAVALSISSYST